MEPSFCPLYDPRNDDDDDDNQVENKLLWISFILKIAQKQRVIIYLNYLYINIRRRIKDNLLFNF